MGQSLWRVWTIILLEIGPAPSAERTPPTPLDPLLRQLAPGDSYDLDELIALSGLDGPRLLPQLLSLELDGRLARFAGGAFVWRPVWAADRTGRAAPTATRWGTLRSAEAAPSAVLRWFGRVVG